jgi:hypothetical protein
MSVPKTSVFFSPLFDLYNKYKWDWHQIGLSKVMEVDLPLHVD